MNTITRKIAQKSYKPFEQVDIHPQILDIKELNQEEPCDVFLWRFNWCG
jgi:hypothetical protein